MDQKDIKTNLIKLLEKVDYDENFSQSLKQFIEKYDGTDTDTFTAVMMQVIVMLMYVQKLEVKSKAFDKMDESDAEFTDALNKITSDYDKLSKGEEIIGPSQLSE